MSEIRQMPQFSEKSRRANACSVCGSPPGRSIPTDPRSPALPVVDLDTWIEQEGNVEVCYACALEIGGAVGMIASGEVAVLRGEVESLTYDLTEVRNLLAGKDETISALSSELAKAPSSARESVERAWAQGYAQAETDLAAQYPTQRVGQVFDPEDDRS